MAHSLELSGGIKLTSPNPADAYYRPSGSNGYADAAAACAAVPTAVRIGRDVLIAGQVWSWGTDISDAGLTKRQSGGGGAVIGELMPTTITTDMVQADGSVRVPVPDAATGVANLHTTQADPSGATAGTPVPLVKPDYLLVPGELRIAAQAGVLAGDVLTGQYYVQGNPDATPENPFGLGLVSFEGFTEGGVVTDDEGNPVQQYVIDQDFWNAKIDARIAAAGGNPGGGGGGGGSPFGAPFAAEGYSYAGDVVGAATGSSRMLAVFDLVPTTLPATVEMTAGDTAVSVKLMLDRERALTQGTNDSDADLSISKSYPSVRVVKDGAEVSYASPYPAPTGQATVLRLRVYQDGSTRKVAIEASADNRATWTLIDTYALLGGAAYFLKLSASPGETAKGLAQTGFAVS